MPPRLTVVSYMVQIREGTDLAFSLFDVIVIHEINMITDWYSSSTYLYFAYTYLQTGLGPSTSPRPLLSGFYVLKISTGVCRMPRAGTRKGNPPRHRKNSLTAEFEI